MRASVLAILSVLLSVLPSAACATSSAGDNDAPREVRAVLERQEEAWNAGDLEGFLAAGYLDSPELTFLSGGDWQRGYAEVLERYRRRYLGEGAEMGRLAFGDLEIVGLAPGAVLARGSWRLDFADGRSAGGLFPLVLRRTGAGWRIVHDHTSSG